MQEKWRQKGSDFGFLCTGNYLFLDNISCHFQIGKLVCFRWEACVECYCYGLITRRSRGKPDAVPIEVANKHFAAQFWQGDGSTDRCNNNWCWSNRSSCCSCCSRPSNRIHKCWIFWCFRGDSCSSCPGGRSRCNTRACLLCCMAKSRDISRFFPRIDRIFRWEALNPFFGAQDDGFSEFRSR